MTAAEFRRISRFYRFRWQHPNPANRLLWAKRNRVYHVECYPARCSWGLVEHASVGRYDGRRIHWRELQAIKTELWGPERMALQVFPGERHMIDRVNHYHLWVMPRGFALPFGLHISGAWGEVCASLFERGKAMNVEKPPAGLWRKNPQTPEGKYLVKRRDGTVPDWPSLVIGAKDPAAPYAIRAYADAAESLGMNALYVKQMRELAAEFEAYRLAHGDGDPDRGRHRKDDPATVAEMRRGHNS